MWSFIALYAFSVIIMVLISYYILDKNTFRRVIISYNAGFSPIHYQRFNGGKNYVTYYLKDEENLKTNFSLVVEVKDGNIFLHYSQISIDLLADEGILRDIILSGCKKANETVSNIIKQIDILEHNFADD